MTTARHLLTCVLFAITAFRLRWRGYEAHTWNRYDKGGMQRVGIWYSPPPEFPLLPDAGWNINRKGRGWNYGYSSPLTAASHADRVLDRIEKRERQEAS